MERARAVAIRNVSAACTVVPSGTSNQCAEEADDRQEPLRLDDLVGPAVRADRASGAGTRAAAFRVDCQLPYRSYDATSTVSSGEIVNWYAPTIWPAYDTDRTKVVGPAASHGEK